MSSISKTNELTNIILKVIDETKPHSVKQLTKILRETLGLEEEEILQSVLELQAQGKIKLEDQAQQPRNLGTYLKTGEAAWYWLTIAAGAITVALVLTISETVYPWIYARNFMGVIFVLLLPGYAFIKALFPINLPAKASTASLETIERIALSIGMSIALVSIIGLLLYYSPLGLDLTAVVLSLFAFTSVFATAAVVRENQVSTHN